MECCPIDVFCAPVQDYAQLTNGEQANANGYILEIDHPRRGPTKVIPFPMTFSESPADSSQPEPMLGEHSEMVLRDRGYSDEEIESLRSAGVI